MGKLRQRFRILEYLNRSGTASWRVAGTRRDGTRIRENFADVVGAQARQIELEAEFYSKSEDTVGLRATKLSHDQIRIAEVCFPRLDRDEHLIPAVEHWLRKGRHEQLGTPDVRLDDALEQFKAWLAATPTLREDTKRNLRTRLGMFVGATGNMRLDRISPEDIERFLANRNTSAVTRDNDRRTISRFFSWTMLRPRHWLLANPCAGVKVDKPEKGPPVILTLTESKALLAAAEGTAKGAAGPFVALCLFAGLRPTEATRLRWNAVNLLDREVRIEAEHSKTGRPRVVSMPENLCAWLRAYEGKPFTVSRRTFDSVKAAAGFAGRGTADLKPWTPDVMRHTAISHRFRATGSYGLTAEWAGNSESIIKQHYQGRVSSEETAAFFAIVPKEKKP